MIYYSEKWNNFLKEGRKDKLKEAANFFWFFISLSFAIRI